VSPRSASEPAGNGDLPPAGRKRAVAALERLERQEEESHRRLQVALERGNPVEIQAAQDFWLKCSETLRRLDLAVELARRSEEEQISKKLGEDVALHISDWLRIAFVQFLSAEAIPLMGLKGCWRVEILRFYAVQGDFGPDGPI
jgi:hypothetical protein